MKKVAIIGGLGEGAWHFKTFIKSLNAGGYSVTSDTTKADFVVAHSGGCFFLPPINNKQTIIVINPPYWPDKSLVSSMIEKIKKDYLARQKEKATVYFFKKTVWNSIYLVRGRLHAFHITKNARKRELAGILNGRNVVLVRNSDDALCTPNIGKEFGFKTHTIPGEHDDIWIYPDKYISILKSSE